MSEAPRASHQTAPIPIRLAQGLHPTPFPRPLTSFFGRERERAQIATLVAHDETRLITLVGPGGVGKTRLALQIATDLQPEFALIGFASLAPATDPAQIVPAAAEALGLREPALERIADQLAGLPTLLVLDNLEQIPGAAVPLAALLAVCASLILIATSRTVLRISGEQVVPVAPFATDTGPLPALARTPAVQLFTARAQAAEPTFRLDDATIGTVAQICRQLDGLPLAIELAAGQVRVLTPQEILSRMDHRLEVLTAGPKDQPERQQSLERAIRWSYDLLTPTEQRIVRRLGVFSGGFSEEAAREIVLDAREPVLPALSRLIDASMLVRSVPADGESRYALLETIREFCQRELRASGEESEIRQKHADYYLHLAARAEPRLIVIGSAEWVRRLAIEQPNLREAIDWSLAHDAPEPVLKLAGTLLSMAYARGEPAESLEWLERAIEVAGPLPSPELSDALFAASALAQVRGDLVRSVDYANRSLESARAVEYPFGEGRALLGLGISAEWEQDISLAEQRYRAARAVMQNLDLSTRLSHWRVLPVANLADIALIRGNYQEAIELGEQAVASWREAGYLWGTAQALGTVAAARCELGDLPGAQRDYQETLDLWNACADGRGIAGTIAGIASIAVHSGDPLTAARLLGAAWNARATLDLEFVAHHIYVEQVRSTVLGRAATNPRIAAAESRGRELSLEEAMLEARDVLEHPLQRMPRTTPHALSAREREVLACIVDGMHDRQIADQLSISPRTVQSHVLAILNKLGAHSRAEAVAIALRSDLI